MKLHFTCLFAIFISTMLPVAVESGAAAKPAFGAGARRPW
jgi:hypothetical protein